MKKKTVHISNEYYCNSKGNSDTSHREFTSLESDVTCEKCKNRIYRAKNPRVPKKYPKKEGKTIHISGEFFCNSRGDKSSKEFTPEADKVTCVRCKKNLHNFDPVLFP